MPLPEARLRVEAALAGTGMSPVLTEVASGSALSVVFCRLIDQHGRHVPMGLGMGKGSPDQAQAGARFEALEHFHTGPACLDAEQIVFRSGRDLAEGFLADHPFNPLLTQAGRLACHPYRPLPDVPTSAQGGDMFVPVCLSTSWYADKPALRRRLGDDADYRHLARYAANSGSAIGTSLTEALLHALNECVERDALSVLIARAFFHPQEDFRLRRVDPTTLPADLAVAHRQAERQLGSTVALVDITTELGLPTYGALAAGPAHLETRSGFGASLSPHHAAWRALSEVLQTGLAYRSDIVPRPRQAADLSALQRFPVLYACGRSDFTAHLARAVISPFPGEPVATLTPREQLRQITGLLVRAGHAPAYRRILTLPNGITSVHVFVPGLERFVAIANGMLVVPGPRARAHLTHPTA